MRGRSSICFIAGGKIQANNASFLNAKIGKKKDSLPFRHDFTTGNPNMPCVLVKPAEPAL